MGRTRTATAVGLLAAATVVAALSGLLHYSLTAEYGDVTAAAHEAVLSGATAGTSGVALLLIGGLAVGAVLSLPRTWVRVTAVAIPVALVAGTFAVTPLALRDKLESQYDAAPRCVVKDDLGAGPGLRAARQSQRAFASVEHVGHFGGGGESGVGGCSRQLILTEHADVLAHYRSALPAAGWQVVEDEGGRLRAQRGGMAFEVSACDDGGLVWAGPVGERGRARCAEDL